MADLFSKVVAGTVDALVRRIVIPVTSVIPFLVSSGILLAGYALLWALIAWGLATNQVAVAEAWRSIQAWPLPALGVAWLLALPPMAGLWVWSTDWPLVLRLVVIAGLAGWNLLVFIPRHENPAQAGAPAQ